MLGRENKTSAIGVNLTPMSQADPAKIL